ncbi:MAG: DUF2635 domain-containing protein [Deltaproteobacteria bacterium HGW-Deltaproteobacteria-9]|jgi:hypothetical protein|nr:MAG: DUF2635 domain-containing protein [Deltaproteobacteria bacterium HGW-Deltaproteobacteria-9]
MRVQAAPGTKCPKEGKPREYIDDQTTQTVPDSAYYMRLVSDGSLVVATITAAKSAKEKGGKE